MATHSLNFTTRHRINIYQNCVEIFTTLSAILSTFSPLCFCCSSSWNVPGIFTDPVPTCPWKITHFAVFTDPRDIRSLPYLHCFSLILSHTAPGHACQFPLLECPVWVRQESSLYIYFCIPSPTLVLLRKGRHGTSIMIFSCL